MRFSMRLASAMLLAVPAASAAVTVPRLTPSRDVTIAYEVQPNHMAPQVVVVQFGAGGTKLRITGETLPTIILVDRPAGVATLMVPLLRAFTSVSIARYDPERTVLRGARFERHGTRRVAGWQCSDWTARSSGGSASACITEDGVILEGTASDGHGVLGSVEARRVSYGALPADALVLPPDYRDAGTLPMPGFGAPP